MVHLAVFLAFLHGRRRSMAELNLADIDAFIVACRHHYARTTVADMASSLRGFLRFLHITGRLAVDLAPSVMAPIVRRGRAAAAGTAVGEGTADTRRHRPLHGRGAARLCPVAAHERLYGLGAGEVLGLRLEDIDWRAGVLHVTRPKTGVAVDLPLLPAVAWVLVAYLRHGRPRHAEHAPSLREPAGTPWDPRRFRGRAAHPAQTRSDCRCWAPYLGSHVLRHTHACRELEQGVPPKTIGDILGHRRPESTSAYLRVATERLREVALALPA